VVGRRREWLPVPKVPNAYTRYELSDHGPAIVQVFQTPDENGKLQRATRPRCPILLVLRATFWRGIAAGMAAPVRNDGDEAWSPKHAETRYSKETGGRRPGGRIDKHPPGRRCSLPPMPVSNRVGKGVDVRRATPCGAARKGATVFQERRRGRLLLQRDGSEAGEGALARSGGRALLHAKGRKDLRHILGVKRNFARA